MKKYTWYGIFAVLIFCADRITKYMALSYCAARCQLSSFLAFEIGYNRGVTWGLFHSHNSIAFFLVSMLIVAITLCVVWYAYDQYRSGYSIIGETLIVAGSAGNIIDRFWHGGVVDFIELSYGNWIWPSFNIADAAIVLGVLIMLVSHLKRGD